jgi:hypothetical protein
VAAVAAAAAKAAVALPGAALDAQRRASWQNFNYDSYSPPAAVPGGSLYVNIMPTRLISKPIPPNFLGERLSAALWLVGG